MQKILIGGIAACCFLLGNYCYAESLKTTIDKIIEGDIVQVCTQKTNGFCEKTEEKLEYLYRTEKAVEYEPKEIISERTENSQSFQAENGIKKIRIYPGQPFIKYGDTWYHTETGYINYKDFLDQASSPVSFFINTAKAQSPYYAGAGDGCVYKFNSANWTTTRSAASGEVAMPTDADCYLRVSLATNYLIDRLFFPFNTGAIPSTSTIATATLYLYTEQAAVDGVHSSAIIEQTQESNSTLGVNDFDNLTLNSPLEGATRKADNTVTNGGYTQYGLNETGLTFIKKNGEASACGLNSGYTCIGVREGNKDIDNIAPAGNTSSIRFYTSEYTGTSRDPYLEIGYYFGEEEEEATTTTQAGVNCENNNDISIICGRTDHYESSSTAPDWFELHYYRVPWWLYIYILTILFSVFAVAFYFKK